MTTATAPPHPRDPPRLDIQGLRAVAVTLVVLAHAGVGAVAGGYVGVDVFFVVSGFLITSLLTRESRATGRISVRDFYARRAVRLLPAATLVVLCTLAGCRLFLSKIRFAQYAGDALGSSLYAVNFRLAAAGTDYLGASEPPSPFQHFWSLAVEEQFYLLWPLLLVLCLRWRRRPALPAALALTALCAASFALSLALTRSSPSWAYFGSPARFWELGAGALLALGAHRLALRAPLAAALSWAGLTGIVVAALTYDDATPFPGRYALLPVVGTLLVLAGGRSPGPSPTHAPGSSPAHAPGRSPTHTPSPARYGARLLLARRPVARLGGLSYGWYLWHWPLLVIGPAALNTAPSTGLALALCAVALALAWATLRLVENPIRFHAAFRRRPALALRLGGGLSAGAAVAVLTAAHFPPAVDSGRPAPDLRRELTAARDPALRLGQLLRTSGPSLPSNLTPPLAEVKPVRSAVYRDGCHAGYARTSTPPCVYGDPSAATTVVLFGDSHAAQWFPALDRLARERHWKLVSLTKASCNAATVTTVYQGGPAVCDTWRRAAVARIAALRPGLVLVSSSDAGRPLHPAADPVRQWTDGFRATFTALAASGARVAALLDTPWPASDAVECAAAHPLRLGHCASRLPDALRDPARQGAVRAAATAAGAAVIDPAPWLCATDGTCPVLAGDTLVYRDDSHMSETYADALAPVLGRRLTALLP
ncbi:acyltransferase family protein [Streptomyces sp. NPDC087422]|uniref:acyltransferase family protein n=1 Tax=Streptomyces sp. NPDC087422 TaxID=3365786 RepID=UPI003821B973